ncbi:leucine-rich PPR motif-containing protein, mitochondrial [Orussus abietinus]|uniref:leucine-rich PPR motif-containing protein, mitochondrial n=1 Tax=Orussus abietinus TaxID=222816 RepID=UPI000626183E|nr:leucine-rich PPR motif-containing protein, mitochondrial [Orussus abietinus]XP_012272285.1 leucine-rich PPR motif-containing protein, mitochondrial [Orussus abietinus]
MALMPRYGKLVRDFVNAYSISRSVHKMSTVTSVLNLTLFDWTNDRGYHNPFPKRSNLDTSSKIRYSTDLKVAPNNEDRVINPTETMLLSLCSDASKGVLFYEHFINLFNAYKSADSFSKEIALLFLQCCGNVLVDVSIEKKRELTSQMWDIVKNIDNPLTLNSYELLLNIYAQNLTSVDPNEFVNSMTIAPNQDIFHGLLNIAAKTGNLDAVSSVILMMKDRNFPVNINTFNLMVRAQATNGNMTGALTVIKNMESLEIEPTPETFVNLSYGYAKLGDIDKLEEILRAKTLNNENLMEIIGWLSHFNHGKHIDVLLKYIQFPINFTNSVINNTIISLICSNHFQDACKIIDFFLSQEMSKNTSWYIDYLLKQLSRVQHSTEDIVKYVKSLATSQNNNVIVSDMLKYSLQEGNKDLALCMLENMKDYMEVRVHYYWPLLLRVGRLHGEHELLELVSHMVKNEVRFDYLTLHMYVYNFMRSRDPFVILEALKLKNVLPAVSVPPLLAVLLENGRLTDAIQVCTRYNIKIAHAYILPYMIKGYIMTEDVDRYVQLIKMMRNNKVVAEEFILKLITKIPFDDLENVLKKFLKSFKEHSIFLSNNVCTKMKEMEILVNNQKLNLDSLIDSIQEPDLALENTDYQQEPKNVQETMSIEDLECHLIELKSKNMNTRGVLRKLFLKYCNRDNVEKVENLLKELEAEKHSWSLGMKAAYINFCLNNNMIEKAVSSIKELQNCSEFKLSGYKIINCAIKLIKGNKVAEAFEIVEQNRCMSHSNDGLQHAVMALLKTMCMHVDSKKVDKMINLLIENGYHHDKNKLQSQLLKAYILEENLSAAVDLFENSVKEHRNMALAQRLIITLLQSQHEQAQILLTRVLNLIKTVYDFEIVQLKLMIGLALLNKHQELRDLIKIRPVRFEKLRHNITLFRRDEKLKVLNTFLTITKDYPLTNRMILYEELLSEYNLQSDTTSAINLWEQMYLENLKPSRAFYQKFAELLQSNKMELPETFVNSNMIERISLTAQKYRNT